MVASKSRGKFEVKSAGEATKIAWRLQAYWRVLIETPGPMEILE